MFFETVFIIFKYDILFYGIIFTTFDTQNSTTHHNT